MFEDLCESYGADDKLDDWDNDSTPFDPESFTCLGDIGEKTSDINTVIVGPNGKLYLTDGHHSFSTFYDMKQGGAKLPVYVQIQENWSSEISESRFWKKLAENNNSWLYRDNKEISYNQMPTSLGRDLLVDDPYRGIMYFTKQIGWDKGEAEVINYLEFHWSSEFRNTITLSESDKRDPQKYLNKIKDFSRAMIDLNPNKKIGISGYTARELGQKESWDKKSVKTLNKLLCDKGKLGKLGFALVARNIDVSCN